MFYFEEVKAKIEKLGSLEMTEYLQAFTGKLSEDELYDIFMLMWSKYKKWDIKYIKMERIDKSVLYKIFNLRKSLSRENFHKVVTHNVDMNIMIPLLRTGLNIKEEQAAWHILFECNLEFAKRNYEFIDGILGVTEEISKKRRWFRKINILDAGSGYSSLAAESVALGTYRLLALFGLKKYFNYANVYALDLNMEFGSEVVQCVRGDLRNMPFSDGFFDIIYSSNATYYFSESDAKTVLKEVFRILRKDGVFLFDDKTKNIKYYEELLNPLNLRYNIEDNGERFKIVKLI